MGKRQGRCAVCLKNPATTSFQWPPNRQSSEPIASCDPCHARCTAADYGPEKRLAG